MKRQNSIVIILLVISLAFNVYILVKINNFRELTANDYRNYLESTVGEELNEMKDAINQIMEEQQWLSDLEILGAEQKGDKRVVELSWQMKDFISGSEVSFYLRKTGDDEFKQYPVTLQSSGYCELELEIEAEDRPQWLISYQYDGGIHDASGEKFKYINSSYSYEYFITLNQDNHIVSSDVKEIDLKKIIQVYSVIEGEVFIAQEQKPSAIKLSWDEDRIIPLKIVLKIHNKGNITEEELTIDSQNTTGWKSDVESFDKLIIYVQYNNGKSFEKEIWHINKPINNY